METTLTTAPRLPTVIQTAIDIRSLGLDRSVKHKMKLTVDGMPFVVGNRFFHSMLGVIGQSSSIFNLFKPDEVLERFVEGSAKRAVVRFSYEKDTNLALALSSQAKVAPTTGDLNLIFEQMVSRGQLNRLIYNQGVVTAECKPLVEAQGFMLGRSAMGYRYSAEIPVDGYGGPSLTLAMLRLICTNGAVAMSNAFRQPVNLGEDVQFSVLRALSTFTNMDGWEKLRVRIETAYNVPASLAEYERTWNTVQRACIEEHRVFDEIGRPTLSDDGRRMMWGMYETFQKLGGDIMAQYGIASLNQMDSGRKASMAVPLSIADLVNMLSEVSTHYTNSFSSTRTVNAEVGRLLDMKSTWNLEPVYKDLGFKLEPLDMERYFPGVVNRSVNIFDGVGRTNAFSADESSANMVRPVGFEEEENTVMLTA